MLRPIKETFNPADYPDLLIGLDSADDAAVWKLNEREGLVLTTDFFTPIVDDPYDYGAIAAANSLSDVYAMGGKPFLALNITAFPPDLPVSLMQDILRGGAEKAREAGVVVAGGHSITDAEPKFGMVVVGWVNRNELLTKGGVQVGDRLFLSKPLGFGVVTTAHKRGLVSAEELGEATDWMKRLNAAASRLAVESQLGGGTDVTGFGLLGHAHELAEASGVELELRFGTIPFLKSARKFAGLYTFPGGAHNNAGFFGPSVSFDPALSENERMLLFDPQTSGGLLLAVPPEHLIGFRQLAAERELPIWEIGRALAGEGIRVLP